MFEPLGAVSAHGRKSLWLAASLVVVELRCAVASLDRDSPQRKGLPEALLHLCLEPLLRCSTRCTTSTFRIIKVLHRGGFLVAEFRTASKS